MNRSRRRSLIILLALGVTAGLAAKPGGGGGGDTVETYPPVVPAHDFAAYVSRPDLGGVLDTETNIVWGYSYYAITQAGATYNGRLSAGTRYPGCFAEKAAEHEYWGNLYLQRAQEEPDRADFYLAASAEELRLAAALRSTGEVATMYNDWRLPTLAEARAAVAKGLFTAGESGLNLWTEHPADLVITPPRSGPSYWTADDAGRRKRDSVAWAYDAGDGSAWRTTGICGEILVRTNTP